MTNRCPVTHTKYQPTNEEWKCPKCYAHGLGDWVIDNSDEEVAEQCVQLHVNDELYCYKCQHHATGKSFAALCQKKKKNNLVPCQHCRGTGLVKKS